MTAAPACDKSCLIVGYGYLGSRTAELLAREGWQVWATTRTEGKLPAIHRAGCRGLLLDLISGRGLEQLPRTAAVVYCAAPPRGDAHLRRQLHGPGLRRLLHHLAAAPPRRFVLASSTGVYGQTTGEWITEQTPAVPATEAGQVLLAAERQVRQALGPEATVVLRLAGLYGPGRVPYLGQLRAGEPLAVPRQGLLNLIHADDAACVVRRVLDSQEVPPLLLVADGHPVARETYYAHVAQLAGLPPPRWAEPDPESPKARRATSSKRISNRLLLESLKVKLRYACYRQGLAHALASVQ